VVFLSGLVFLNQALDDDDVEPAAVELAVLLVGAEPRGTRTRGTGRGSCR
jgi:hypothetical protein